MLLTKEMSSRVYPVGRGTLTNGPVVSGLAGWVGHGIAAQGEENTRRFCCLNSFTKHLFQFFILCPFFFLFFSLGKSSNNSPL